MPDHCALIVDDEPDIRELLEITLARMGLAVTTAGDLATARRHLTAQSWSICLTDMRLPDGDGLDLVREISAADGNTPIAVITAYGSMETAITALKHGAFDFVTKPLDVGQLRHLIEHAVKLDAPANRERAGHNDEPEASGLLGDSEPIRKLRRQIRKMARSQAPVVIAGESGTGKELAARLIHEQGPRSDQPFVPVNCGAIPRELMESEFFGHKRGAFTGAVTDNDGLFVAASGGTLFLDEIGELPLDMQVKLLRVIQEKRVRPVGGTREVDTDVRILSATNIDLAEAVARGDFRRDLFYRLHVIALHVPPLRERTGDIPLLADAILNRLAAAYGHDRPALAEAALATLQGHDFPGNVRELENILERALALADGDVIGADDLQLPPSPADTHQAAGADAAAEPAPTDATSAPVTFNAMIDDQQRQLLVETLTRTRWNRTAAARELGLTYRQLRYRLKKLGID